MMIFFSSFSIVCTGHGDIFKNQTSRVVWEFLKASENINRWSIERHLNISLTFNLNMIIIQHVKGKFAEVNIYLSTP